MTSTKIIIWWDNYKVLALLQNYTRTHIDYCNVQTFITASEQPSTKVYNFNPEEITDVLIAQNCKIKIPIQNNLNVGDE